MDERMTEYTGEGAFDSLVLNDGGFDQLFDVLREML